MYFLIPGKIYRNIAYTALHIKNLYISKIKYNSKLKRGKNKITCIFFIYYPGLRLLAFTEAYGNFLQHNMALRKQVHTYCCVPITGIFNKHLSLADTRHNVGMVTLAEIFANFDECNTSHRNQQGPFTDQVRTCCVPTTCVYFPSR